MLEEQFQEMFTTSAEQNKARKILSELSGMSIFQARDFMERCKDALLLYVVGEVSRSDE